MEEAAGPGALAAGLGLGAWTVLTQSGRIGKVAQMSRRKRAAEKSACCVDAKAGQRPGPAGTVGMGPAGLVLAVPGAMFCGPRQEQAQRPIQVSA